MPLHERVDAFRGTGQGCPDLDGLVIEERRVADVGKWPDQRIVTGNPFTADLDGRRTRDIARIMCLDDQFGRTRARLHEAVTLDFGVADVEQRRNVPGTAVKLV